MWLVRCLSSLWDWWLGLRMTDCRKFCSKPNFCYELCALKLVSFADFGVSGTSINVGPKFFIRISAVLGFVSFDWISWFALQDALFSCWKSHAQMSLNKHLTFGQLQPPASPVLRRCWELSCGCAAAGWKVTFALLFSDEITMAWKQQKWICIFTLCRREVVLALLWFFFLFQSLLCCVWVLFKRRV